MQNIELIPPRTQKIWHWPAVANLVLSGAGTGFYLLIFIDAFLYGNAFAASKPLPFGLVAPVIVSLGFFTLTLEAGRPFRGQYLFRHLRHSWISREVLAFAIFVPAAFFDWLFPNPILRALSFLSALGLMITQGFIVYRTKAITSWNVPIIPIYFISSGLASATGLALLIGILVKIPVVRGLPTIAIVCVIANLVVWILYLYRSRSIDFRLATGKLRRPLALITTVGLGHVIPLILLLYLTKTHAETGAKFSYIFAVLSGLAIFSGVTLQKNAIILKSAYIRGINLRL